ncbi:T6SS immunity protein Tli4 family protein [Geomesophilobacter sediminis]|uniref:Tle cognate immunity protein 4 C-terminal domain-containing protein n=1 Tax=Geomesophilobacter sediminis TaxID=2798584 RepID=A0A8J7S7F0_9BACT|nr:T6SS immunity protein Tli4 family protein [Geomesophilobacter sediminis]MBJ6727001.1 hypothetical protein [Geomesophilobacter sediminis]
MGTNLIGRFSVSTPTEMEIKLRSSMLRRTELKEIRWSPGREMEARSLEWERQLQEIHELKAPEGKKALIITQVDKFPLLEKWAKGIYYYHDFYDEEAAQWSLLLDSGPIGLWIVGKPTIVEMELINHKMAKNIENIALHYQTLNAAQAELGRASNGFYLSHGVIDLPYSVHEESIARFEGHPLQLSLLIEMYMDARKEIETTSLISGTRAMLAASLFIPGSSMSKIRLQHREVAGMPGEESVLRIKEGDSRNLVFTWRFNGKYDSGEYPTTRIEMESPDGNLDEKLQIWDAILDSMKPMFVRKPS